MNLMHGNLITSDALNVLITIFQIENMMNGGIYATANWEFLVDKEFGITHTRRAPLPVHVLKNQGRGT